MAAGAGVFAYIAIGVFVFVDTPRGVAPATPLTANLRLIYTSAKFTDDILMCGEEGILS